MITTFSKIPYPPPLDIMGGANVAVSLRKLLLSYMGKACRVRRSSDNVESDIGFNGLDFDVAGFSAFVGAGTGYVTTLYDQTGNGHNATQTVAANQPAIALAYKNGKAAINFTASSSTFLTFGTALGKPADYTIISSYSVKNILLTSNGLCAFGSIDPTAHNRTCWGLNQINSSGTGGGSSAGCITWSHGDGVNSAASATASVFSANVCSIVTTNYVSGVYAEQIRFNGLLSPNANTNGTAISCSGIPYNYCLGRFGDWNAAYFDGYILDFIQYSVQLSNANQSKVENAVNDYYAIF